MTHDKTESTILKEADALVGGIRLVAYGHPLDDYTRTAAMWSAILGTEVTPEKAMLCMIAVKISRECNCPKRDNRVDIAGYAKCLDWALLEKETREAAEEHDATPTGSFGLPPHVQIGVEE
uniref:Putative structural protein n=1 Tax=viral metagenome TaxID=1070528 RepID=A0A6M3JRA0_9ZZZZ